MMRTIKEITAINSGFRYQRMPSTPAIGVSPLTNPTSSSAGFFFVKKLMTMVNTKQMSHAHHARQKLAAISL